MYVYKIIQYVISKIYESNIFSGTFILLTNWTWNYGNYLFNTKNINLPKKVYFKIPKYIKIHHTSTLFAMK